ncbi:MAG: hypothetical protein LBK44_05375 [Spirochaetales bacterium]|jgi:hypothetical protein|nr:hypothetical protein [Spirochaetales bacterium]
MRFLWAFRYNPIARAPADARDFAPQNRGGLPCAVFCCAKNTLEDSRFPIKNLL